jgi:CheY-like chemotaxis protein
MMPDATGGNASGNAKSESATARGVAGACASAYPAGTPEAEAAKTAIAEATKDTRSALCAAGCANASTTALGGTAASIAIAGPIITRTSTAAAAQNHFIQKTLPKPRSRARRRTPLREKTSDMTQRTWRVLIADDDPAICTLIETVLRKGPYQIVIRNDAESALVALDREGLFDIIICDFMLPGISGIDLIERLRADERTRNVPILMISGHTNYAMDGRAKTAGANLFLNKPFTISQLRTAVNSLLAQPKVDPFENSAAR